VREAARKDSTLKFTALLHQVNVKCLMEAFFNLMKTAAVGIDEVTWHEYEQDVEANIVDGWFTIHRHSIAKRMRATFARFAKMPMARPKNPTHPKSTRSRTIQFDWPKSDRG
jgi:hypothetical protein